MPSRCQILRTPYGISIHWLYPAGWFGWLCPQTEEVIGHVARFLFCPDSMLPPNPSRDWDLSRIRWQVDLEQTSSGWLVMHGGRFLAGLSQDEALGCVASLVLNNTATYGGLRTYEDDIRWCPWPYRNAGEIRGLLTA